MTPAQAIDVGSKLIQLLSQQRLLYRQLKELAQKQSGLVDGSDPEMLLRVLASRQRLIDKLSVIDKSLEPIRADWQSIAKTLPPKQRTEAQDLVSSVQQILGEILANDERDTQVLMDQQKKVSHEIRNTSQGKQMNQAYVKTAPKPESRYFDSLSE
jgi:hypothetical protein